VAEAIQSSSSASIVVTDDEPNMCAALRKLLGTEGYAVEAFTDPERALEHVRRAHPDVVLADLIMPTLNGIEVLKRVRQHDPSIMVIMITAHGTIDSAIEAVKEGAFHYITKPFNTNELLLTIRKALDRRREVAEKARISEHISRRAEQPEIVGSSKPISDIRQAIEFIAPTDSTVLIIGETGTGKELVAREIHHRSSRRDELFVAINCASIPESLLESELFGHEKGAFTGADRMKIGLFELAHQGTLLLDEIAELPLVLQAKLLRALERCEIQRIGGLRPIVVDIRLIAATNRSLERLADEGKFRRDLFFRLNVVRIHMPTLREIKEDIPSLVAHILKRLAVRLGKQDLAIDDEAVELLRAYWWPGNVRELENVLERTAVLLSGQRIAIHNLPPDLGRDEDLGRSTPPMTAQTFRDARDQFEREYFTRLLAESGGNVAEAARRSQISRRHLHEKINELGIQVAKTNR